MESADFSPRIQRPAFLGSVLLLSFLLALWVQWPRLIDPFQVEEDFRTLYWIQAYADPDLFPNEPFKLRGVTVYELFGRRIPIEDSSPGYSLLFLLGAQLMAPALLNKLLVFPLMAAGVYFLYRIGEQLKGPGTAVALTLLYAVLNLGASTELSVIGGLHRSFVTPFLLALLYFLMNGRHHAAAVVVLLSGWIYMPIFPVAWLTALLTQIVQRTQGRWRLVLNWRQLRPLLLATIFVAAAVSPMIVGRLGGVASTTPAPMETALTEPQSDLHILEDPSYQPGGRRELFRVFPLVGRGGIVTGDMDAVYLLVFSLLAAFIWLVRRGKRRRLQWPFQMLFVACWVGFAVAWSAILLLSSFLFYIPSRHTQGGFFLLLLIFVVINAEESVLAAARWLRRNRQRLIWYVLPVIAIAIGFAVFLPQPEDSRASFMRGPVTRGMLLALTAVLVVMTIISARRRSPMDTSKPVGALETAVHRRIWHVLGIFFLLLAPFFVRLAATDFYNPSEAERALYFYVNTLPKDTVLGGDPCALDSVPFYGKRSVLFSCERFQFLTNERQTVLDTFRAYYAADPAQVAAYCRQYGIDKLIVDVNKFAPAWVDGGDYFFEPYDTILARELPGRTTFALMQVPPTAVEFAVNGWFVVPCTAVSS